VPNPRRSETRRSRKARTAPHQGVYDSFLQKLIKAREAKGFTQREISERMGMSHSFLSKCETGERSIDVMELLQLAELYGKSPEYFLKGD
jgi:transcriptional regulator with XRE-family HTH domain